MKRKTTLTIKAEGLPGCGKSIILSNIKGILEKCNGFNGMVAKVKLKLSKDETQLEGSVILDVK